MNSIPSCEDNRETSNQIFTGLPGPVWGTADRGDPAARQDATQGSAADLSAIFWRPQNGAKAPDGERRSCFIRSAHQGGGGLLELVQRRDLSLARLSSTAPPSVPISGAETSPSRNSSEEKSRFRYRILTFQPDEWPFLLSSIIIFVGSLEKLKDVGIP